MKKFLPLIFIITTHSAFSALSPFYQSQKEIKTLLSDENFIKKMSFRSIDKIERTSEGYLVTSGMCNILSKITYKKAEKNFVGPVKFDFTVSDLNCPE